MSHATQFTPWLSLGGGLLVGLATVMLMAFNGRIAGMTGILGGAFNASDDRGWRLAFLAGSIAAPAAVIALGHEIPFDVPVSTAMLLVSGVVVGIGVTYGSGCTSGHGVCGLARLSRRSLVATLTFMATAFATVFVVRHLVGG